MYSGLNALVTDWKCFQIGRMNCVTSYDMRAHMDVVLRTCMVLSVLCALASGGLLEPSVIVYAGMNTV